MERETPEQSGKRWHELGWDRRGRIEAWRGLAKKAEQYLEEEAAPGMSDYLFRGQANIEWDLKPSLARMIDGKGECDAVLVDEEISAEFRRRACIHLPAHLAMSLESPRVRWPLMRHHGAPTRLLDWTSSLLVATYFAVSEHWDKNGVVFVFKRTSLQREMEARFPDYNKYREEYSMFEVAAGGDSLYVWTSDPQSDRMSAQQGFYTVSPNPLVDHGWSLGHTIDRHDREFLIIPAKTKPKLLRHLHAANLTAAAMFPGLDGLGRSLHELVMLRTVRQPG